MATAEDWQNELRRWLGPFLSHLGHKARRRMCPLYVAGLIGPGERKSVQPMASRTPTADYDQLHHFVGAGIWDEAPLERGGLQVHGVDANEAVVEKRRLRRGQVLGYFAKLAPCRVGLEACATAHFWARELRRLGHEVRLIPPQYVKAYLKRGKNDAADAAAICEAATRPSMRFVPIKSEEQQAVLIMHRARDLLVRQRTQLINALRGHLAEFGLIEAQGPSHVRRLLESMQADSSVPELAR